MRNDLFTEQVESYFIEINLGRDIFWGKSSLIGNKQKAWSWSPRPHFQFCFTKFKNSENMPQEFRTVIH